MEVSLVDSLLSSGINEWMEVYICRNVIQLAKVNRKHVWNQF